MMTSHADSVIPDDVIVGQHVKSGRRHPQAAADDVAAKQPMTSLMQMTSQVDRVPVHVNVIPAVAVTSGKHLQRRPVTMATSIEVTSNTASSLQALANSWRSAATPLQLSV